MNKHNKRIFYVFFTIAILFAFGAILLVRSGIFTKDPKVEAVPDNCYSETLHVITDKDYSPYSFYDENGQFSGHDVELITLIANRLHMNLDLKFMDWNDGIATITAGGADVLMTCDYSDSFAGTDQLVKSAPTSTDEFTVYAKERITTVSEMYGKRIAIMENGNVEPQMEKLGLMKYCIKFKDNRTAMQALNDGKADYAVMRQTVGITLIKELELKGIKAYFSAGQSYMCFGVNNTEPELVEKINSAIEELRISGDFNRLNEKWLTTFVRPYTFRELMSNNVWMIFIFVILITVLVFTIFYNKEQEIEKEHEQQVKLEDALGMAETANRAKTAFLNSMSHDIRTPMNAILGFNMIAQRELGKNDDKVRDSLNKVRISSENLLNIINDILAISRIESGKVTLQEENGDALLSFANIEPMMKQLAQEAGIDLQFSFGKIEDRYVICDIAHTTRIFTNLISNAIKYSKPGGWVKVHCEQTGRRGNNMALFQYTVEDNGIGMSPEFQKQIFTPFSREHTTTVSKIQGTGLGLAMSKNLAKLMGGDITFVSEKGKGSKFTVTLPFFIQDGEESIDPATFKHKSKLDFTGKRVLLVEDNEMNREIATAILSDYGIEVIQAEDGDIAVRKIKEAQPDDYNLVFMDIQMPTIDGYEATRQIRALDSDISQIPIIAMTANAFDEDRQLALEAGMDDHIAKPIDIEIVEEMLTMYL